MHGGRPPGSIGQGGKGGVNPGGRHQRGAFQIGGGESNFPTALVTPSDGSTQSVRAPQKARGQNDIARLNTRANAGAGNGFAIQDDGFRLHQLHAPRLAKLAQSSHGAGAVFPEAKIRPLHHAAGMPLGWASGSGSQNLTGHVATVASVLTTVAGAVALLAHEALEAILVDGQPVLSCLTLACAVDGPVTALALEQRGLKTIGDLAQHSAQVKFGAPSEFLQRTEGLPGLKAKYGLDIAPSNFIAISDGGGPATVRALVDGTVTAADIFSTSPAIVQNNLVVLEDPKHNFLAANVVPLVASQKKSDLLKTVLDGVSAKLTTKALIDMNTAVSGNSGVDADQAARKWVQDNGFDKPVSR